APPTPRWWRMKLQLAGGRGDVVPPTRAGTRPGRRLLGRRPGPPAGDPAGRTLVAVDSVGAGVGENVFFVRGREASFPFHPAEPPVDAGIVGIVDHWDVEM